MEAKLQWKGSFYHERQNLKLCGLHCLNNLHQAEVFTRGQLNEIAAQLDHEERQIFQGNVNNGPPNFEKSGNYSAQVLSRALQSIGAELVNLRSTDSRAIAAREKSITENAFICNRENHWFSFRNFQGTWYTLDSRLHKPRELTVVGSHLWYFSSEETMAMFDAIYLVCRTDEI